MSASLYTTDFYAWAQHQSDYLRLEEFDKIDWQNIAEELQDLGNQTRREVESRLRLIIMHLLKWQWQPDHQSRSWRNTINVQRRDLMRLLKKNPTLRTQLSDFVPDAYAEACEDAFKAKVINRTRIFQEVTDFLEDACAVTLCFAHAIFLPGL
jgi:hypothetical protein